jgi:hypothetical protein
VHSVRVVAEYRTAEILYVVDIENVNLNRQLSLESSTMLWQYSAACSILALLPLASMPIMLITVSRMFLATTGYSSKFTDIIKFSLTSER